MALDLKAACGSVVRPDIAPRTITIRAGVHTGFRILAYNNKDQSFLMSNDTLFPITSSL